MPQSKYTNSVGMDERIRELQALGWEYEDAIQQYQEEQQAKKQPNRVDTEIATTGGDAVSLGVPTTSIEAQDREPPEIPAQAGSNTALRILEVLGGIGGSLAESKAMGKATKATQAAQARANLINTLRGRAVSGVQPTEPKRGILGTLSRGLGAGAKAFREGREFESQEDKTRFEAEMALGELDIKREKSEKIPPVKPTERKAFYTTEGRSLWAENPDLSVAEIDAKIRASYQYRADGSNPEFLGFAREGYKNAKSSALSRKHSLSAEERAVKREGREVKRFNYEESKPYLNRFEAALKRSVKESLYKPSEGIAGPRIPPELANSKKIMRDHNIDRLDEGIKQDAYAAYDNALADYWENRKVQLAEEAKIEFETSKLKWSQEFQQDRFTEAKRKADFDIEETLRTAIEDRPALKAFTGKMGMGPSYLALKQLKRAWDTDDLEDRGTFHEAFANSFQRMLDPATVREGDIALIREAEGYIGGLWARVTRFFQGGFVTHGTIEGMMDVADELHEAHRKFVGDQVDGAILQWMLIHPEYEIDDSRRKAIVDSILLGTASTDRAEETVVIPWEAN